MRLIGLFFLLINLLLCSAISWADTSFWHDKATKMAKRGVNASVLKQTEYKVRTLFLNEQAFKALLETAPTEALNLNDSDKQGLPLFIDLPLPDGDFATLEVEESLIMEPDLAEKFPEIRTWKVRGDNKKVRSGRIDFTSKGFHAMLTMINGDTTYIDPLPTGDTQSYQSISVHKEGKETPFMCQHDQIEENTFQLLKSSQALSPLFSAKIAAKKSSGVLHNYRIAVAATSAFTVQNGGTKASALASIVTIINRVNEIYQRDISVKLILVANNDAIIYTNIANDPYGTDNLANLHANQTILDAAIGNINYDIGHVFDFVSRSRATGLAQVSSVCNNAGKAKAVSGFMSDLDNFATNMVAHEIGHQFGATHSFNSNTNLCRGNRSAISAYEPGGGTTIMSYAGVCGSTNNIQNSNDPYFHFGNIYQMARFVYIGGGASCGSSTPLINTAPIVDAGRSYVIPANTPIELQGKASDNDAEDYLSYSWEQLNTTSKASHVNVDDGANAIFRVYPPIRSSTRIIPSLVSQYSGVSAKGDIPPKLSRLGIPLLMGLLVRDQKMGVGLDTMSVFVKNTGRSFALTSHKTATMLSAGDSTLVRWNVAKTNESPILCRAVDIFLLTGDPSKGDTLIETILLKNTNNNGSATITLPANTVATQRARIKVKCSNNIFFALSAVNFPIDNVVETSNGVHFSVANSSTVEGDSDDATIKFTVVMSSVQAIKQTVFYTTFLSSPLSAVATDFNHLDGGGWPVVFLPGETEKVVSIKLYGDSDIEQDETFRFILFRERGTVGSAIGTIRDDDTLSTTPSSLSISDATITEGLAGITTQLHFIVQLSGIQSHDVDVKYTTSDNSALLSTSATAGVDYKAKEGVFVIAAGETQGVINIDVFGDQRAGHNENFSVILSSPSANAFLANKTATGLIVDNGSDIDNDEASSLVNNESIFRFTFLAGYGAESEEASGGGGSINIFLLGLLLMLASFKRLNGRKSSETKINISEL